MLSKNELIINIDALCFAVKTKNTISIVVMYNCRGYILEKYILEQHRVWKLLGFCQNNAWFYNATYFITIFYIEFNPSCMQYI